MNDTINDLPKGWELSTLNKEFDVRDGTHESPQYIHEGGYPFITSKNLKDHGIDFTDIKLISKEDYVNFNRRSKVDRGDLLFAMIGTIENPTIVDFEPAFTIKNDHSHKSSVG